MKKLSSYTQKDLGYPRAATDAYFQIEMPDRSLWRVPVQCIADSRDEHYADEQEDTIGFIRAGQLDDSEIHDWAGNNMNWDEVERWAFKVERSVREAVDFQEGWCNGEKEIIGKL